MSASEPDTADLRLLPAALAAWAGMWIATSGQPWLLLVAGSAGVVICAIGWRRRSWPVAAVGVVVVACVAGGGLRGWLAGQDQVRALADQHAVVVVEGRLEGSPRAAEGHGVRPPWWSSTLRLTSIDGRGGSWMSGEGVQLSATGHEIAAWAGLRSGTLVRATVRLEPAEPGDATAARARAREPPVFLAGPTPLEVAVESVRQGLRDAVAGLDPEPRSLVPALVVGDTSAMPDDLTARFKLTGLTHLTAVSGANLVLLLGFLGALARTVGLRGWWLRGVMVLAVAWFVLLCRAEPSVVRAAAMGLVGLAALGWSGRGRAGLRPLCVAVIGLVLFDPFLARSIGFALSVLASGGIIFWAGRWVDALVRWLPRWLAEALAVPLAAQLATQPLVSAISGKVSLVGLLANVAAGPLVGPATVLGFAAAGVSQVWMPPAVAAGWLAGWCAQGLCWIARLGELLPGAQVSWPATPPGIAVVAAASLGLGLLMRSLLLRPWLCVAAGIGLVAALVRPPGPPGWPPAQWAIAMCDVGQGDATLIRAGPHAAVLIDAGPEPRALARCLLEAGVDQVPVVVLTHFHADHIGGLAAALAHDPARLVTSFATTPDYGVRGVLTAAGNLARTPAGPGTSLVVGEATLQVLAVDTATLPGGADEGESAAENDGSLVLRAASGGVSVLLGGDVQEAGQANAVANGGDLRADVLLVPHHGSSHQDPGYLAAVGASVAVFSVGKDNDYGHPAQRTLRAVGQLGLPVARTDLQGSLAVSRDETGRLVVTSQR